MTNEVKPFFIRITEDMTPQMVQDAFDKCVDAGAAPGEGCLNTKSKHEYKEQYSPSPFRFFGVDDNCTTYMDIGLKYFSDAQEITLDQLDEWLGLESKAEWNDEELPPIGFECELEVPQLYEVIKIKVVSHIKDEFNDDIVFYEIKSRVEGEFKYGWCYASSARFIKPETPEQKAERGKKEAIDEIKGTIDFFADSYMSALSLYEQGYRKK